MILARTAIFVATERFDLRRSFDGLAGIVKEILRQNPLSGALFMFFNKSADKLKIIWWDKSGYCVLYKRLERGTFRIPNVIEPGARSIVIEAVEMAKILEGVALPPRKRRTEIIGS
jgi:transposase